MACEVEYTDEFERWWEGLDRAERVSVDAVVRMLESCGPQLGFPQSSRITQSKHPHMRELRIQHAGNPYRVFYAFDPRRVAILLIGGAKRGDDRWYTRLVPLADKLYSEHIAALTEEGLIDG
ncbi:MAG: type II toxin-antitoxin system RelE/ParE family toxin [Gemmatimonas sp.]